MEAALPRAMTMAACAWGQTPIRAKNWGAFLRRLRWLSITFFKSGKVFGSLVFVTEKALGLGHRFKTRSVTAHPVGEIGYSTHGWRLAQAVA